MSRDNEQFSSRPWRNQTHHTFTTACLVDEGTSLLAEMLLLDR